MSGPLEGPAECLGQRPRHALICPKGLRQLICTYPPFFTGKRRPPYSFPKLSSSSGSLGNILGLRVLPPDLGRHLLLLVTLLDNFTLRTQPTTNSNIITYKRLTAFPGRPGGILLFPGGTEALKVRSPTARELNGRMDQNPGLPGLKPLVVGTLV